MFDVTIETRDNSSVIILKSRLSLQVILPARASLVTPSLIDDSAVSNITKLPTVSKQMTGVTVSWQYLKRFYCVPRN